MKPEIKEIVLKQVKWLLKATPSARTCVDQNFVDYIMSAIGDEMHKPELKLPEEYDLFIVQCVPRHLLFYLGARYLRELTQLPKTDKPTDLEYELIGKLAACEMYIRQVP